MRLKLRVPAPSNSACLAPRLHDSIIASNVRFGAGGRRSAAQLPRRGAVRAPAQTRRASGIVRRTQQELRMELFDPVVPMRHKRLDRSDRAGQRARSSSNLPVSHDAFASIRWIGDSTTPPEEDGASRWNTTLVRSSHRKRENRRDRAGLRRVSKVLRVVLARRIGLDDVVVVRSASSSRRSRPTMPHDPCAWKLVPSEARVRPGLAS